MTGVGEQDVGRGEQPVDVLGQRARPLPGVEHPRGAADGQGRSALSDKGLGQLGARVRDHLWAEEPGGQLPLGEANCLQGSVDQEAAGHPVAALDHDVQRAGRSREGQLLDEVAVQRGQVQICAALRLDDGLVLAVVQAYGRDGRLFAVVAADTGAFGVFLRPAAARSGTGDTQVGDPGGRGEVPAGGAHAGQYPQPGAAEVLARLLLAVGLHGVRHLQTLGQGREQRAVEVVDLLRDAVGAEGMCVGPLVVVTGLAVGDDGVRGVVEGAEVDLGGYVVPVADPGRGGEGEGLHQGRADVRCSVDLRADHEHDAFGSRVDDVRPEQVLGPCEGVGENGVRRYGMSDHRDSPR